MTKHKVLQATLPLLWLTAVACGLPRTEEVERAFLKEHPAFVVTDIGPGEGGGGYVYVHIRYRSPGLANECEVVWGYLDADEDWRTFYKGQPGLAGTVCDGCERRPCA